MKLTVGRKIALLCTGLLALTALMGGVAVMTASRVASGLDTIATNSLPGLYEAAGARAKCREIQVLSLRHIMSSDAAEMADLDNKIRDAEAKAAAALQSLARIDTDGSNRQALDRAQSELERRSSAWTRIATISKAGNSAEALARYKAEVQPIDASVLSAAAAIADANHVEAERQTLDVAATSSQGSRVIWIVLVFSVVVGTVCAYLVMQSMQNVMKRSVQKLLEGAEQVASAAGQIAASSQSLAQGASEQSASLEETSASTQEIRAVSHGNSERVGNVVALMQNSERVVTEVNEALRDMTESMTQINNSSESISRIIKVIDEIAFQTNILALNAAVEAARAGDAGMGFAVVADEVRNLAQRCAQAAKDTSNLIEESITRSREGSSKLDHVAQAIAANSELAGKVNSLAGEVNSGSIQQSRGIEQIASAISEMESVVQRTAASAEESASAAQELTAQASGLRGIVHELNALV